MLAGEVWAPPEPEVTATVIDDPLPSPLAADPKPAGLTKEGIEAAKALIALPPISPSDLAKLAREIAMNIKERPVVFREYGLTQTQYEYLEKYNEFYVAALRAACIEWQGPLSTEERIKIEAAAILEDSLLGLGLRMQNKSEGLPGVIEAAKLFAKIAGVGERAAGAAPSGERFTINIDLGGDAKISVSTQTIAPTPDAAAGISDLQQDAQGALPHPPILPEPEG